MGEKTNIEWCHHTLNPWRGCTKISAGCTHCYAETLSHRNPGVLGVWGDTGTRVPAVDSYWLQALRWHRDAIAAGELRRVFVGSLMDVGEDQRDLDPLRDRLMALIALTPPQWVDGRPVGLHWLLLTKRPGVLRRYLTAPGLNLRIVAAMDWWQKRQPKLDCAPAASRVAIHYSPDRLAIWAPHLAIGVSVENQAAADERIPEALAIGAATTFLSCEPLLGPVDLSPWLRGPTLPLDSRPGHWGDAARFVRAAEWSSPVSWVIVGGESGPKARPMHPQWARDLRDQCVTAGVPYHFKQWGEWAPLNCGAGGDLNWQGDQPRAAGFFDYCGRFNLLGFNPFRQSMGLVGKHAAGRQLDGRTWDEFPTIPQ